MNKISTSTQNDNSTANLVRRIAQNYIKPYTGLIFFAFIFMAADSAFTGLFALYMEDVMDDVFTKGQQSRIIPVAVTVFACFFLRGISNYIHVVVMNKVGQSIVADIQNNLFAHFMTLDLGFFHKSKSGELISSVVNDVTVMRAAVSDTLTNIGKNTLTLIALVSVMFYKDWFLATCVFSVFPLAAIAVAWIGRRIRKISKNIQKQTAGLVASFSQTFLGIRVVQAYGMEQVETDRTRDQINTVRDLNIKSKIIGSISTPFNEILVGLAICGIIIYGGNSIADGTHTIGSLIAFITAFSMAYEPMKKLAKLNNALQTGLGASERVFSYLDTPSKITNTSNSKDLEVFAPEIEFKNVMFEYNDEDDDKALNNVSISIPSGRVTALVGSSGSGKSTIMNLIPRFYDIQSGEILIDGNPIKTLSIESLRKNISLVSQDITIFSDTVANNIAYGSLEKSRDQIIAAAKAAAANDFIEALPGGYDGMLGEHGTNLSGGQKQRISIARAILRDAPILLLDEATSALDNESEKLIKKTLEELEKGRTTLIIAHRLTTITHADQIIVMDKGEVAEIGTHKELVESKGVYAKLLSAIAEK